MTLKEYTTLINVNIFIFAFFIIFCSSGCSRYIKFLEKDEQRNFDVVLPERETKLCNKPKFNIIHNSNFTIKEYSKVYQRDLNTAERALLYTIYQMIVRPDATDWSSRIQIHIKQGSSEFHQDFGNFETLPLLSAFKELRSKGLITRSINSYLKDFAKRLPKRLTVQEDFFKYLKDNSQNPLVKKHYYKLDNPLQKGETFAKRSFPKPPIYRAKDKKLINLFNVDNSFSCSFDSNLYKKGIFLISKTPYQENSFGFTEPNGNYFYAITKKTVTSKPSYQGQEFFGGAPSSLSPFCLHKEKNKSLVLLGLDSRDPGQLLYHLYNYKIQEAKSPQEAINFLNFPRHQFLTGPSRLLYESEKGSEEQLRYFLSLDFPVYHVDNLGLVHALWSTNNESIFISDQRKDTYQSCIK